MANSYIGSRAHMLFALCLPLAVLLGYMLAYSHQDRGSMLFVLMLVGALSIPVLMNYYHPLLVLTWNAAITPFFLPGQIFVWMPIAFVGLGFAVVSRFTNPEAKFISAPSIAKPLIALLIVVALTAYFRGGIGVQALGSSQYGGRCYFYVVAAAVGYFALVSRPFPKERAGLVVTVFFAAALTSLVPNIAYLLGPAFHFLFYLFPSTYAYEQALGDFSLDRDFTRIYGLTYASNGLYCYLLARYGLRGIFDVRKPVRIVLFLAATLGTLFCGFRSFLLLFVLTVAVQFIAEKLYRPRTLLALAACGILFLGPTLFVVDKLPTVVQRSISFIPDRFLPVPLHAGIRVSAQVSTDWRVDMWKQVLQDVPHYLLLGKGYSLDPTELSLAIEADRRGWSTYAWALVTGAYHNGALTLIVPLGIWGAAAFLWFTVASLRYLYRNYRYGDPSLREVNTFLFAYFSAKLVFYFTVFGSFFTDFFVFTGLVGIGVALNGGSAAAARERVAQPALPEVATAQLS